MQAVTALAGFSPILVILGLRRTAAVGALSGIALALLLIPLFSDFAIDVDRLEVMPAIGEVDRLESAFEGVAPLATERAHDGLEQAAAGAAGQLEILPDRQMLEGGDCPG